MSVPEIFVSPPVEIILQDGHELSHLTEQQDSVTCALQLRENSVQQLKLTRRPKIVRLDEQFKDIMAC